MSNAIVEASYKLDGGQVLNSDTVKKYLVSGNVDITDQEALFFIELCKAQKLNPFVREAYIIKYDKSKPANIVVGKEVFTKRAYRNPNFNGMKAGIVVLNEKGNIEEREGSLKLKNEILVGGWCEVYLKNQDIPVKSSVSIEEYSKSQSTWKSMPCVMIRKCALVTALREAFPEDLQGLYDSSEMPNVPDKLSEKEIVPGMASLKQKKAIMKIAEFCGLYDSNTKDTKELEKFCESNGYDLRDLKYEDAEKVMDLISKYADKKNNENVVEADFKEVEDK